MGELFLAVNFHEILIFYLICLLFPFCKIMTPVSGNTVILQDPPAMGKVGEFPQDTHFHEFWNMDFVLQFVLM